MALTEASTDLQPRAIMVAMDLVAFGEDQGYGIRRNHMRYAQQMRQHRQARGNMGGYRFGGDAGGCH